MHSTVILINPDHRLRAPLRAFADRMEVELIEPATRRLPNLDAWIELLQAHPHAPVVLDLAVAPAAAWELCCALRRVDGRQHRSVLLTSRPGAYDLDWCLRSATIEVPNSAGSEQPLLEALTVVLSRQVAQVA